MFLESSRYVKQKTLQVVLKDGRIVTAITLRYLPQTAGTATVIKDNDRLDVIAQRKYRYPTKFWRIADANTELQANDQLKSKGSEVPVINVPGT